MNAYGQIVGYSTDTTGALLYQNGTVTPIPSLAGQSINYSVATSINNAGEIVGFSRTGVGSALIWSYQGGNLQALPGMSGSCDLSTCGGVPTLQVNNMGQIAGSNLTFDSNGHPIYSPFWIEGGTLSNLASLIDPSDPNAPYVTILSVNGLNDDGWIVVSGIDSRTQVTGGYILKPTTPLPAAVRVSAPSSGTPGNAFILTWTNQSVSSCTASGGSSGDGWTGSMSDHGGQQSITESAAGTYTYTLTCQDGSSSAVTASAKVDVGDPVATRPLSSDRGGGGGGSLDPLMMLALLALAQTRLRASPWPRHKVTRGARLLKIQSNQRSTPEARNDSAPVRAAACHP